MLTARNLWQRWRRPAKNPARGIMNVYPQSQVDGSISKHEESAAGQADSKTPCWRDY